MEKLREQVANKRVNLNRWREMYDFLGQHFSVNPHVQLWRLRYRAIYLFSSMGLWLTESPDEKVSGANYGTTIKEWRRSSKVGQEVTRVILKTLATQSVVTLAELEVLCAKHAKRTAIKSILKSGVELGLLENTCEGYRATVKCIDESFDRCIFKLLDPDVIAFCEFVVMFKNLRENAKIVEELERQDRLGKSRHTLAEQIFHGCLLYTSPSPRDGLLSRMPSSA